MAFESRKYGFNSVSRENNINAIRYYLAICILMNHFCVLTGINVVQLPRIFGGAGSFFAISGFLMFPSFAKNSDVRRYLKRRADRIFPPYFLIVLLAAFLCVFESSLGWREYFCSPGFWKYLVANLSFMNFLAPSLPGVFDTLPNTADAVNGSLWTMKGEVACYLTIPVIFYCVRRWNLSIRRVLCCLMAFFGMGYLYFQLKVTGGNAGVDVAARQCVVMFLFYMGGFLNQNLAWVKRNWKPLMAICGALLIYEYIDRYWLRIEFPDIVGFTFLYVLVPLATGLMVIVCSVTGKWGLRLAGHNAVTYEIYLFHFPIIQTLIHFGVVSSIGFWPALLLSILLTGLMAWLAERYLGSATRLLRSYAILLCIGAIVTVTSMLSVWNEDALSHSFFVTRYDDDASFAPLTSLWDILQSQINWYFNTNGRVLVSYVDQFFCGIAGKFPFAVCNGMVWILLTAIMCRIADIKGRLKTLWLVILIYLVYSILPFTPPYQINYVWVSCALLAWICVFFSRRSFCLPMIGLGGFCSLLVGGMHEGFSFGICCALVLVMLFKRKSLSLQQWIFAGCFIVGSLFVAFAPGNFARLGIVKGGESNMLSYLEKIPTILWMPAIFLATLWSLGAFRNRMEIRNFFKNEMNRFILVAAIATALFDIGFGFWGRAVIPFNFLLVILLFRFVRNRRISPAFPLICGIVGVVMFAAQCADIHRQQLKTEAILKSYEKSEDGYSYIDSGLFLFNTEETVTRRQTYTNLLRQRHDSCKPGLVLWPDAVEKGIMLQDTNLVIKVGDQSWVCIQSIKSPKTFVVEKKVSIPGFGMKMPPRILNFDSKDIQLDSNKFTKSVLYVNSRPYIHSEVVME